MPPIPPMRFTPPGTPTQGAASPCHTVRSAQGTCNSDTGSATFSANGNSNGNGNYASPPRSPSVASSAASSTGRPTGGAGPSLSKSPSQMHPWQPQREQDLAVGTSVALQKLGTATVLYVGRTLFSRGEWVGVELRAPVGKHDGALDGTRCVVVTRMQ